jgi:hypothetical protein
LSRELHFSPAGNIKFLLQSMDGTILAGESSVYKEYNALVERSEEVQR